MADPSFGMAPYPGLRPFRPDESDIFFGREKQTDQLLERLGRHRFLAITGPSGCGKSSLVSAGVIPALNAGFMASAGSSWRICAMRPGDQPMARLACALATPDILGAERSSPEALPFIEAALRRGPLGLVQLVRESEALRGANLLVLADQFEEIFRFREKIDPDEADAFVALLLASAAESDVRIYVVITMRSDYLGDCALFHGLPEAVSNAQYLTPRLAREELAEAIAGPARVWGARVDPRLINRLLNDFGTDPDRLPLLQHALMRMWWRRVAPGAEATGVTLAIDDYEAVGGISEALSKHAEEVYSGLEGEQKRIAQLMFRRLTERVQGRRDIRAPTRLGEIAKLVAGDAADDATVAEVAKVAEAFRGGDRNFIVAREGPLDAGTLIDIGHESLIRYWRTLAGWVEVEAESAETYRRLRDTARLWRANKAGLWGDPDLAYSLQWQRQERPTLTWASRHGTAEDFALAMRFLEESNQARRRKLVYEAGRLRRARWVAIASSSVAVVLVAGIGIWLDSKYVEHVAFYKTLVKVHGVPVGVGELTAAQVSRREHSYKLVREGRHGRVVRMEAVSGSGTLTAKHGLATYLEGSSDDANISPLRQPVAWEFTYDAKGRVAYEIGYNRNRERVWSFIYEPAMEQALRSRTANFTGPKGFPLPPRQSCATFVTIEYSPATGYETHLRYRDQQGKAALGLDKAVAQKRKYDDRGNIVEMLSLDGNDRPMNDEVGNAYMRMAYDSADNMIAAEAFDEREAPVMVTSGYAKSRYEYDAYGMETARAYFDERNAPVAIRAGWHRRVQKRDGDGGHASEERYYGVDGERAVDQNGCAAFRFSYDSRGNLKKSICLGPHLNPALTANGYSILTLEHDDHDQLVEWRYWDADGKPVLHRDGLHRASAEFDKNGNRTRVTFFDVDGRLAAKEDGYASWTTAYIDDRPVQLRYFNTQGRPTLGPERHAGLEREYDRFGNETRVSYKGPDDRPMVTSNRIAGYSDRLDSCGRVAERRYFDSKGRPIAHKDGYAGFSRGYDALGRVTRVRYLGVTGQPILNNEGVAGRDETLDQWGNTLEQRYIGVDGKPARHPDGYAFWRAHYDSRGHRIRVEYFSADNVPVQTKKGYARMDRKLDVLGRTLHEAYFDAEGHPIGLPEGYASVARRYDARGYLLEMTHFDTQGQPIERSDGYARVAYRRDVYGNQIESAYFAADGSPANHRRGYHRVVNAYEAAGKLVEARFLDRDGQPVLTDGYAQLRRRYEPSGHLAVEELYGLRGKPLPGGRYRLTFRYDERGNEVEQASFDPQGRRASGQRGFAIMRKAYDYRGDNVETVYFDENLRPASAKGVGEVVESEYDPHGRLVRRYSQDAGERKGLRRAYDAHGRLIEEQTLDAAGRPVRNADRYSTVRHDLDRDGNVVLATYSDADGKPALYRGMFHRVQKRFDSDGNEIERLHLGASGEPVPGADNIYRETLKYNRRRQLVEAYYLGADQKSHVRVLVRHDVRGNVIDQVVYMNGEFDERTTFKYDRYGNKTEEARYGPEGLASLSNQGYARVVRKYAGRAKPVEERFFGTSGEPVWLHNRNGQRQYHMVRYGYDVHGNRADERYFDPVGKPVMALLEDLQQRCARRTSAYDAGGRRLKSMCLDGQGREITR